MVDDDDNSDCDYNDDDDSGGDGDGGGNDTPHSYYNRFIRRQTARGVNRLFVLSYKWKYTRIDFNSLACFFIISASGQIDFALFQRPAWHCQ